MSKRSFETINGLRGLAALLIVVWHGSSEFGILRLPRAYLAVDLFFVMSGFVIAYSYEQQFARNLTIGRFFLLRMIRLYPIFILATVGLAVIAPLASIILPGNWITISPRAEHSYALPFNLMMLPTPTFGGDGALYPANPVAWSLLVEVIVNMVYVATWRWWSIRNIIVMMAVSAALMLSCDQYSVSQGWGAGGFSWNTLPFGLFRVFYAFPAGVLIYRLVCEKNITAPTVSSPLVIATFPFLLIWPADWACQLVMLVAIPLLVWIAASTEPKKMTGQFCFIAGNASYAVYAMHLPLIGLAGEFGIPVTSQIFGYGFLLAILPIGFCVDRYLDRPLRKMLNMWIASPPTIKPVAASIFVRAPSRTLGRSTPAGRSNQAIDPLTT